MNNRFKYESWQSLFLLQVDKIQCPERKIILLRKRIIELERKCRRQELLLAGSNEPIESGPIKTQSGKDFYRSLKWRKLRFNFFMTSKRECTICRSQVKLHVDHIKPRSLFPDLSLDINNLQILCESCNFGKSNSFFQNS